MIAPLLATRALCGGYAEAQVLFELDLRVERGEAVALMGRNGAGKSTTLKAIIGLLPWRRGMVKFLEHDISILPVHRIAQLGIAWVPEERRVFGDLTVRENLEVGRQAPRRWPDGTAAPTWSAAAVLDLFPPLAAIADRRAAHTSGGEQQMLALARGLMGNPLLILLDEPIAGVAPLISERWAQAIKALKGQGVGILLAGQEMDFVAAVADRVYLIDQGSIRHQASMAAFAADDAARRSYLGL